jgi:hypothetical protein
LREFVGGHDRRRDDDRLVEAKPCDGVSVRRFEDTELRYRAGNRDRGAENDRPRGRPEGYAAVPLDCAALAIECTKLVIERGEIHAVRVGSRTSANLGAHTHAPLDAAVIRVETVEVLVA